MKFVRGDSFLWGACFTLALCIHGAGAAALLVKWNASSDIVAGTPLVMIDMAPEAVAPETTPNDLPPDQVASRAEEPETEPEPEKPIEKIELPPPVETKAEVVLPPPPPKKVEKLKEKPKKKSVAAAVNAALQKAERAAAPMLGAARDSHALPNWRSALVSRLERYKRYPSEARGDAGVTQVAFRVDRSGGAHNVRIARSSGSSLLDRETLALVERAQPLPVPPSDISDSELSVIAPVRYNSR
ncbi:MAG TPA: TonB family protein [Pseudolabrys sp.]|jgi:protein TonB